VPNFIVQAMKDGQFANNRCACHGLNLVVRRCESHSTLAAVTLKVSKVVEHFRRSPTAKQRFHDCQRTFDVPKHKLVQQVSTRWNSMFSMIDRFAEQRLVIGDYANRYSDIENLSRTEWEILDEARILLRPFLTATLKFSKATCSISEVIPTIKWLKSKVCSAQTVHLTVMKQELVEWLSKRDPQYFGAIEQNAMYSVATLLDPRFKTAYFSLIDARDEVIARLREAINQQQPPNQVETAQSVKRLKLDNTEYQCILEEVAEPSATHSQHPDETDEVDRYLLQPKISTDDDPYAWWHKHCELFPNLAVLARYYLATPASSVDDERVFSGTGKLLEAKRNRLSSKNASMLAFLYYNLADINFDYDWPN
jgi:hypothetical protein